MARARRTVLRQPGKAGQSAVLLALYAGSRHVLPGQAGSLICSELWRRPARPAVVTVGGAPDPRRPEHPCWLRFRYSAAVRLSELLDQVFEIYVLICGGAMGIRTPDLLHAISRHRVHPHMSPQVTVLECPFGSASVLAGCCTFPLYAFWAFGPAFAHRSESASRNALSGNHKPVGPRLLPVGWVAPGAWRVMLTIAVAGRCRSGAR